jgi:hypothetical protein
VDNKQGNWAKQAGVTPGKLALIGVLAVVFVGVMYLQFAPKKKPTPVAQLAPVSVTQAATTAAAARTSSGQVAAESPASERKKTLTVANWHSPQLTNVVAYDPFALPAAFPKPPTPEEAALAQSAAATSSEDAAEKEAEIAAAREKSEGELQGLKQQAVQVMITRNDEFVAVVGDRVVHVGDELNGFKVIAIDSDGVHVAKDLLP